jgi:hypothetical protein
MYSNYIMGSLKVCYNKIVLITNMKMLVKFDLGHNIHAK